MRTASAIAVFTFLAILLDCALGSAASATCAEEQAPHVPTDLELCVALAPIMRKPSALPLNEYQVKLGEYLNLGPAVDDRHILALDIAGPFEALAKSAQTVHRRIRGPGVEDPDHWHRRLLRPRSEWPRAAPPSSVMNSRRFTWSPPQVVASWSAQFAETHFVLRRFFFVQPSLDPFHRVSVGTHWVWTRRVGVIGHAGKLVAALAYNSNFSIRTDIDDCSAFSDSLRRSRHGAFDNLVISHLSGRHIVLLSKRQPRNEDDRTPKCQCNVSYEATPSSL